MFSRVLKSGRISALCAAGFLAACATPIDAEIVESKEYQSGYSDGCMTATHQSNGFQSKIVEDKSRMGTDEAYTTGWRQGFYGCGGTRIDTRHYNSGEWYIDNGD